MIKYAKLLCPSCSGLGRTFGLTCGHCLGLGEIDDITLKALTN